MPFIEAKCTNCGAVLPVDKDRDAWVCGYCGTPFIVEKAVNLYNTTVQAQTATVNVPLDFSTFDEYDAENACGILDDPNIDWDNLRPDDPLWDNLLAANPEEDAKNEKTKADRYKKLIEAILATCIGEISRETRYAYSLLLDGHTKEAESIFIKETKRKFENYLAWWGIVECASRWAHDMTEEKSGSYLDSYGVYWIYDPGRFPGQADLFRASVNSSESVLFAAKQALQFAPAYCVEQVKARIHRIVFDAETEADKRLEELKSEHLQHRRQIEKLCQHCGGKLATFGERRCKICGHPKDY